MSQQQMPQGGATEMTEQQLSELLKIRRDKLAALCENGQNPYEVTKYEVTAYTSSARAEYEKQEAAYIAAHGTPEEGHGVELEQPITVSIAGRMMSRRIMGKASFLDVQDNEGHIQVYIGRNDVG